MDEANSRYMDTDYAEITVEELTALWEMVATLKADLLKAQAACAEMQSFIRGHLIYANLSCISCGNLLGKHDDDCKGLKLALSPSYRPILTLIAAADELCRVIKSGDLTLINKAREKYETGSLSSALLPTGVE